MFGKQKEIKQPFNGCKKGFIKIKIDLYLFSELPQATMEELIQKVDALDSKVSKILTYFKLDQQMSPPETPPQSSQGSNSTYGQTMYNSSVWAQREYDYLSLRRFGYHLYSPELDRQNALKEAVKAKTKERVLGRLDYLLSIWKKRWDNPNTAADNIKKDIEFVNTL